MNIPSTYPNMKIVNEDGTMHENFLNFLTQLLAPLQQNLSNEGYTIPSLTQTQINTITGTNTIQRIIYNSTTGKMMINNNGTFQTINVT